MLPAWPPSPEPHEEVVAMASSHAAPSHIGMAVLEAGMAALEVLRTART